MTTSTPNTPASITAPDPIKLDFGCGKRKQPGFLGVDVRPFEGVDIVEDIVAKNPDGTFKQWRWADNSVDEIYNSHFIEHLYPEERIHFVNECFRILKPGAKMTMVAPHWASNRSYGDLTHKYPPIAEMWFFYLSKAWRDSEAPHNDTYTCDFICTWGYSMHNSLLPRNQEYQQYALANYKEAAQDIVATLQKPPTPAPTI